MIQKSFQNEIRFILKSETNLGIRNKNNMHAMKATYQIIQKNSYRYLGEMHQLRKF
jgi:hypothetical protein